MNIEHKGNTNMQMDLEKYVNALAPWSFTVKIGGVVYATRPLLLGDVLVIEKMNREGVDALADLVGFVRSIFVGENTPDVDHWPLPALSIFIQQLMAYWADLTKKNAAQVKSEIDAASPPKTPPQTN